MWFARPYANREWNSTASGNPCDGRKYNSEDDENDDGACGVEAFIAQKDGEGTGIKNEADNKNAIADKMLGPIRGVWHFACLMH